MGKIIDRTGETTIASNGMTMVVIKGDAGHNKLIVQFSDGEIVGPCRWESFIKGYISHPTVKPLYHQIRNKNKLTSISNHGQVMTIIDSSKGYNDLTIQFADGTVKEHVRFNNFKRGEVLNINFQTVNKYNIRIFEKAKSKWLGQTRKAKNGLYMKVIEYNGSRNITVKFEDNTIVPNVSTNNFNKGLIAHPNYSKKGKISHNNNRDKRLGETNIASNGMTITIIEYRTAKDLDIQFDDKEQTIVTNKTYDQFKKGTIEHPLMPYNNKSLNDTRIGETKRSMSLGIMMKIIASNNADDIDIQFEDDAIVRHRSHQHFKTGRTSHSFPHQFKNIMMKKLAYINNDIGNFYCKCLQCGHEDIWNIEEMKNHECEEITND